MNNNYEEYKALDKSIDELYGEGKYEEAIEQLEASYNQFPDFDYELKTYTLYLYRQIKNSGKCIELLKEGVGKGYIYGLQWSSWDYLRDHPQWDEIEKKNEENRAVASDESKMEYRVYKPEGYDEYKSYPLMILLHGDGNGCNIEDFSKEWKPETFTNKGFIVAYLQSSYPECSNGFGWTNDYGRARKDILEGYNKVCEEFSVDMDNIHLGGFSGGAEVALSIMLENTVPARGFLALCPDETEGFCEKNMMDAKKRGIRLAILEGEKSGEVLFQQEFIRSAKKNDIPCIHKINENAGHCVPENWNAILDETVDFLIQ